MNHAIAVKAVIQNEDGKFLMLKRSGISAHASKAWDIPGGRIDPGEDPFTALKRECVEEAGLQVEIGKPLNVNYFTRDDGQIIVMIMFLCNSETTEVILSEEHEEYEWVSREKAKELIHPSMESAWSSL